MHNSKVPIILLINKKVLLIECFVKYNLKKYLLFNVLRSSFNFIPFFQMLKKNYPLSIISNINTISLKIFLSSKISWLFLFFKTIYYQSKLLLFYFLIIEIFLFLYLIIIFTIVFLMPLNSNFSFISNFKELNYSLTI